MIHKNSRYEKGIAFQENGKIAVVYRNQNYEKKDLYDAVVVTVIEGDTLQDLAYKYFENTQLWWIIAELNNIFNPNNLLTPGQQLIIPSMRFIKEG